MQFIQETLSNVGPFLWVIYIVSALVAATGAAIIVERSFFLFVRYNINGNLFFQEIRKRLQAGKIDDAIKICNDAPLPSIIKAGLVQLRDSSSIHDDPRSAMGEKTLEIVPMIRKRTHYLTMIANVATLLGLLGTIIGLIIAFEGVVNAEPGRRATQLANGIRIAMSTTAFGLVVAIPCMICYSYLQAKTTRILDEIDEFSVKILHIIDRIILKEE